MEKDFNKLVLYILSSLFIFFIGVLITRYIFSINEFLKYQKAQTKLLKQIAIKNGVSDEDISKCLEELNK